MPARRRVAAVLSSLLLGLPVPLWDHPGYDAEDSHFNPHATITVGSLTKAWSANLRQVDESCSGFSAPIVAADQVFVTDREGVSSYGVDSGDLRLRFTWDDAMDNSTPRMAVAGNLLILANGGCNSQSDPDGQLTALDFYGRTRWKLRLDPPIDTVVVDKGVVLVSGWSPSDFEQVAAYRVTDGHPLWSRQGYASSGVSADGLVPLQKTDGSGVPAGETTAVDIVTGKPRWTRPASWQVAAASPAFGRFYATDTSGALAALNAGTGAVLWSTPGKATSLMATDGPRLYLAAGSAVSAVDAATGHALWSRRLPAAAVQPTLAAGLLFTGGPVLTASTGKPTGVALPGSVVAAGGLLYQVDGTHLTAYSS
ncbi:PQQ-binding-like beta-propeller repeat protein [Actinoplanes oblitus]|uniref:PQQ-binding-like beta-propeller repeat protein n=1 Tax=Actinoplanes oblitus TaxID=3040509 RepID=A0ABY8WGY7_9ACTN|nr:PQQ-binding-like beta-propeller repeat protein [Actinoplanes oblitus]WIM96331.1 PQQ-binding-like beta-propeller repeat protein [Actinoplanes oblitus]